MKAILKWEGGLNFKGQAETGIWVQMGPSKLEDDKPKAATPMELLLLALAGCTSMDIVSILQKKRVQIDDYWVEIEADKSDQHPKVYRNIHLKFVFVGKNLKVKDLEQAAKLSAEKYCSVGAMIGKVAKITHEIVVKEKLAE